MRYRDNRVAVAIRGEGQEQQKDRSFWVQFIYQLAFLVRKILTGNGIVFVRYRDYTLAWAIRGEGKAQQEVRSFCMLSVLFFFAGFPA